jgi:hypothetical protein
VYLSPAPRAAGRQELQSRHDQKTPTDTHIFSFSLADVRGMDGCGGADGAPSRGSSTAVAMAHCPQRHHRTGLVESVIGNSPEILRFLWGAHAARSPEKLSFLEPTMERLDLEERLDRYGRNLQVWVYYHLLHDRDLTLQAWGANNAEVPAWQRQVLRVIFPVLARLIRKSFAISDEHYTKSVLYIEELLSEVDTALADGRGSILGGGAINYTDLTFAAFSGLWLQPKKYGGGKADASRIEPEDSPAMMRADTRRWREDFPGAIRFIERLYEEER